MWRLGIDLGTNSLGWAVLELNEEREPIRVLGLGSHIFTDGREPKTKESLAVARRNARGVRRMRDRKINRIQTLVNTLEEFSLPLNRLQCPYESRYLAINQKVSSEILARALFHICQNRGFKSNRKADNEDKEDSLRKAQMSHLKNYLLSHNLQLGEFLYQRHKNNLSTRFREGDFGIVVNHNGDSQTVYPNRALYWEEFQRIKEQQGNLLLSEEQWDKLEQIIFFQRPLKPQQVGLCEFEEEERAHKSLPISQLVRLLQEVNNLKYQEGKEYYNLSGEQSKIIINELSKKKELKFSSIRKLLKLKNDAIFNLEVSRDKLLGDETGYKLNAIFNKYNFLWSECSLDVQNEIVNAIINYDESELAWQQIVERNKANWKLPESLLAELMKISFPSSYARLSVKAMQKILPYLEKGFLYYEAATEVYGGHTDLRNQTGEVLPELPYYGEVLPKVTSPIRITSPKGQENVEEKFGKISNPTVHIALNRLRHVVNALIVRFSSYGNLTEIHLELAKELKLKKKKE